MSLISSLLQPKSDADCHPVPRENRYQERQHGHPCRPLDDLKRTHNEQYYKTLLLWERCAVSCILLYHGRQ